MKNQQYKTPQNERKRCLTYYYQNKKSRCDYGRMYARNKGRLDWHCVSPGCKAHFTDGNFAQAHRKVLGHEVVPL